MESCEPKKSDSLSEYVKKAKEIDEKYGQGDE